MAFREAKLNRNADEYSVLYHTLPFWALAAFYAAERAFRLVEAENIGKDPTKPKNDMRITKTNSTAFAAIEAAQLQKESSDGGDIAAVQAAFENDSELSNAIFDFLETQINGV